DRALERDPDDWQALAVAARLHLRNRRFGSALDAAAASLALSYFQPVIHHVLGRALAARGDLDGAEKAYKVALAQMPGLPPSHEALARPHPRTGRPPDATSHRARAAELRRQYQARVPKAAPPAPQSQPAAAPLEPLPTRDGPRQGDP